MKKALLMAMGFSLALSASVTTREVGRIEINRDQDLRRWKQGVEYRNSFYEVTAVDCDNHILFATTGVNVVQQFDLSLPSSPVVVGSFNMEELTGAGGINSVAWSPAGYMAVALEAKEKTDPGMIAIFTFNTALNYYEYTTTVTAGVGALPDMITAVPAGESESVLFAAACEGEPNKSYDIDPEGSLTLISKTGDQWSAQNYGFERFNSEKEQLRAKGVRIYGNNGAATVAQDFEPEYIAVSSDGNELYVSLQENNAVAVFDMAAKSWSRIMPLGSKDHSLLENALDVSNKDDAVNITPWPVHGLYLPDAIAALNIGGKEYIFTANEGDSRDYKGYSEEFRVGDKEILLDPAVEAFRSDNLTDKSRLGRLKITTAVPDSSDITVGESYDTLFAEDGVSVEKIDTLTTYTLRKLYSYGGRSFSVFDSEGNLVWDSKSEFETKIAELFPNHFNASNVNNSFDNRSDDKGPEPEAIALGRVGEKYLAFIGLERMGGVMIYDITDPASPIFETYINNRDYSQPFDFDDEDEASMAETAPDSLRQSQLGDLGPETIQFVSAEKSPTGSAVIIIGNEVSGTVSIYEVGVNGSGVEPAKGTLSTVNMRVTSEGGVQLTLPQRERVAVSLYSPAGRKVSEVESGLLEAGVHTVPLGISNLSAGVYMVQVSVGSEQITRRLVNLR